jgi:ketopantoate reductase
VNVDTILIWGAGAIGGTIGAYWKRAGVDVLLVDKVAEHVEACRTQGLSPRKASRTQSPTFLPFHPGAARYYREKAVPVRPGLLN